jgi:succinate dehydrogenase / fumarate reductase, cytochrome b subunit
MKQHQRPLSPHLQVYRPQLTSVLSIFHRITGMVLVFGLMLLTWWLIAAAAGPEAFAVVQAFLGSWFGLLVLLGVSFALFYHLCNGVRHLIWDAGHLLEIEGVYRSGWVMLGSAVALTVIAWVIGLAAGG